MLRELGIAVEEDKDHLPRMEGIDRKVRDLVREEKVDAANFIVLNPGAKFAAKCWSAERFGEVARWAFSKWGARTLITGTASEAGLAEAVAGASAGCAQSLAGRTSLLELASLLRMARACVTNDTGTMHIAAMTHTPTVALFATRLSPPVWWPLGNSVVGLCNMKDCECYYIEECTNSRCLHSITKDAVVSALEKVGGYPRTVTLGGMPIGR